MTLTFILALVLVLASAACSSSVPADGSNVNCVSHLEVPVYPPIAHSARVIGAVRADVTVAASGTSPSVTTEWISGNPKGAPLLVPAVEQAVTMSTFDPSCAGRMVRLIFDFQYPTRSEPGVDVQMVAFEYPNRFKISVTPPLVNP